MFKKIFIIFIIFLFSVGFACASDNETLSDYDYNEIVVDNISISVNTSDFEDIQNKIDDAEVNSTISLSGVYTGSGKEITIDKDITIEGLPDAILDAQNSSRIFNITGGKVTLKNLYFINANSTKNGGAIYTAGNLTIINSSFLYNSAEYSCGEYPCVEEHSDVGKGGAIFAEGDLSVSDSFFNANSAWLYVISREMDIYGQESISGGSIYCGGKLHLDNDFILNNLGCAILTKNAEVLNSRFLHQERIFSLKYYSNISVINSSFDQCGIFSQYTAINLFLDGCNFTNGHEFIFHAANLTCLNSKFINYTYPYIMASIPFIKVNNANITNSVFRNNYMPGHVILDADNIKLNNCTFENNTDGTIKTGDVVLDDSLNHTFLYDAKIVNKFSKTYYKSGKSIKIKIFSIKSNTPYDYMYEDVYRNGENFYDYPMLHNGILEFDVSNWKIGKYDVVVNFYQYFDLNSIKTPEIKFRVTIEKIKTMVKAPKVVNKFKKSKYFKITVKSNKKVVKKLKLKVKVFTGNKYKTYNLKTNSKGIAKLNTKTLKKGNHKVVISSGNSNYKVSAKSMIKIK